MHLGLWRDYEEKRGIGEIGRKMVALPCLRTCSRLFSKAGAFLRSGREQSVRQRRVASQVEEVICKALQQGHHDNILQQCGFQVENVEMSGDLRKAFVFWRSKPGMQVAAEKQLKPMARRLRSLLFSHLCLPFSPSIQFVEDLPDFRSQQVEEALKKLREGEEESEVTSVEPS